MIKSNFKKALLASAFCFLGTAYEAYAATIVPAPVAPVPVAAPAAVQAATVEQPAAPAPVYKDATFTGAYAGLSLGFMQTQDKTHTSITTDNSGKGQTTEATSSGRSPLVAAQLGYGFENGSLYFGGELEGVIQKAPSILRIDQGTARNDLRFNQKITMQESTAFALRLGSILNKVLVYAKGGLAYARWTIATEYPELANNLRYSQNKKRQIGFVLGGGADFMVRKNIVMGAEVAYFQYKKFDYRHGEVSLTTINPSALRVALKLNYKF